MAYEELSVVYRTDEDTLENRGIFKCNADCRASGKEVASLVAELSWNGNEAWGISKLTAPIKFGQYEGGGLASTFQKMLDKKSK